MKYGAICADPPWTFKTWSDKGKGRSAERHYSCMTPNEMAWIEPQHRWAAPDCALFLWVTDPMLKHGIDLNEGLAVSVCDRGVHLGQDQEAERHDQDLGRC